MCSKKCIHSMIVLVIGMTIFLANQTAFAQSGRGKHNPSPSDCDAYARNYAERYSNGFLGGAARGAVGGGVFGAIIGGGKGAKRGALLGGAVRGTQQAVNRDQIRRRAYDDCMAGRVKW